MGRFSVRLFVCPFVRPFVIPFPPLGHPSRPEIQPAKPEAWGLAGWLAGWLGLRSDWLAQRGDGRTNGRTDKQKNSPFYRTSSPIGAAAQKPPHIEKTPLKVLPKKLSRLNWVSWVSPLLWVPQKLQHVWLLPDPFMKCVQTYAGRCFPGGFLFL